MPKSSKDPYNFVLKKFDQLTLSELYDLLRLRNEVFIVEQKCSYQDLDYKDYKAHHFLIYKEEELIAYSRIFPEKVSFNEASIGRIIVCNQLRSTGLGRILMEKSIESLFKIYGEQPIRIGAQFYAVSFYKKFGFETEGDIYLEDQIEHIEMIRKV
jgi:ElaA protein